ncbi:hypothetical protein CLV91_1619 [Maribacter vaceletii]|uniref:DNA topoisomerase IV n=1 Tax=Maribacter vaceletii TaxID=1206816 RepID=A0A495EAL9_9FLAO|nr:hypothetical protein [Maribacter vaceletii]RKR12907.1 hypothetical protein CLV91_1619 [Maribacter vaceletii]
MIKKLSCILLLVLSVISCYQPERNCSDFKTGEFLFTYEVNGVTKTGKFIRDKDYSVDYYDNKIDSASVRWLNDCEFVLKDLNNDIAIHYKILSTTKNSYTFEYKNAVKDTNKKLIVRTGTATKTK